MQREIMTSIPFLSQPSAAAENNEEDLAVAQDLKDTLDAHRNGCVGMAANMIGVPKRIIAFVDEDFGGRIFVMFNPHITAEDGAFDTAEGCLSLQGERRTVRYQRIEVGLYGSEIPRAPRSVHRFHRADHPTRDRPLRWRDHLIAGLPPTNQ